MQNLERGSAVSFKHSNIKNTMEFSFKNLPSYLSAKNFVELSFSYTKKDEFRINPELKIKIERTALSLVSNIAKITATEPDEKTKDLINAPIQSINELSALYSIALDRKLIQPEDIEKLEEQLQKILECLLKLKGVIEKQQS